MINEFDVQFTLSADSIFDVDPFTVTLNGERLTYLSRSGRVAYTNGFLVVKIERRREGCNECRAEAENYQRIPDEYKHLFAKVYAHGDKGEYSWIVMEHAGESAGGLLGGSAEQPEREVIRKAVLNIERVIVTLRCKHRIDITDVTAFNIGYNTQTKQAKVYDTAGWGVLANA